MSHLSISSKSRPSTHVYPHLGCCRYRWSLKMPVVALRCTTRQPVGTRRTFSGWFAKDRLSTCDMGGLDFWIVTRLQRSIIHNFPPNKNNLATTKKTTFYVFVSCNNYHDTTIQHILFVFTFRSAVSRLHQPTNPPTASDISRWPSAATRTTPMRRLCVRPIWPGKLKKVYRKMEGMLNNVEHIKEYQNHMFILFLYSFFYIYITI